MKKTVLTIVMTAVLCTALRAQNTGISTDTMACGERQPDYYYSEWYDTAAWYVHSYDENPRLSNVNPALIYFNLAPSSTSHQSRTFQQYTPNPIRVRGLWAMVSQTSTTNPESGGGGLPVLDNRRLPEYLYLYVRTSQMGLPYEDYGTGDPDTVRFLRRVATVRWDTAQPKMLCLKRDADNDDSNAYCHIYEVLLDTVLTISGEYWIGGTTYSTESVTTGPAPHGYLHFPTRYLTWGTPRSRSIGNPYKHTVRSYGPDGPWDLCDSTPFFGPFGVITDGLRHMEVGAANPVEGTVDWTAYYPDSSYQTITAVPDCGYRFSHWNDGDTSNPRRVFVTQDTAFFAYFDSVGLYGVAVRSDNGERGEAVLIVRRNDPAGTLYPPGTDPEFRTVGDDSSYCQGHYAIMKATAYEGFRFVGWNDGVTDNPRWVRVTQDTAFTAHFGSLTQYRVELRSSDESLGHVTGDSVYDAGDEAVIRAVPLTDSVYFAMWDDGVADNPRTLVVTQDTVFTAIFMVAEDTNHIGISPVGGTAFKLRPNPTDGEVRVETAGEAFPGGVLAVTDASGREVQRHELAPHTPGVRLDLSALPQGTYFVTLRTEEGSSTKKLVLK